MWGKPKIAIDTDGNKIFITCHLKAQDYDIVVPKGTPLVSTQHDINYVLPEDIILRCEPTLSWSRRIWRFICRLFGGKL